MIQAWYEKIRDRKDELYFDYTVITSQRGYANRFPGFHDSVEFAFGLKGTVRVLVNETTYFLHEGEVLFINGLEPHRYFYECGQEVYIVLISRSFFNERNRLGRISWQTHMAQANGFRQIKRYLDYAWEIWDGESNLCKQSFADMVSFLMMRYYPYAFKQTPEKQGEPMLRAVKYICEHSSEPLTVAQVAKRFGYSANYFSTLFNDFMQTGFSEYVNICRMVEFETLRKHHPELSVRTAAEQCGFGSMNTFYRVLDYYNRSQKDEL